MHPTTRRFDQTWSDCNPREELSTAAGFLAGVLAGGLIWTSLWIVLCVSELF